MDTIKNPIFHGRRSTHGVKNDSTSHKSTEAHSFSQRMETIFDVDMFKSNDDEPDIDLIKVLETKDKADLYSLFSEVVRMEFKLDDEQGEQLFSE
ncbi:unnamed protein product [Rotaria magnacalcarata]|uniref:Uncharacterized protein n=1 Tax=Rotaria magnacalcarata TaxID=392030 RepID=A0A8S2RZP9_9BILA|nr:unnamed protein product [Rotaria magnacalcarata]